MFSLEWFIDVRIYRKKTLNFSGFFLLQTNIFWQIETISYVILSSRMWCFVILQRARSRAWLIGESWEETAEIKTGSEACSSFRFECLRLWPPAGTHEILFDCCNPSYQVAPRFVLERVCGGCSVGTWPHSPAVNRTFPPRDFLGKSHFYWQHGNPWILANTGVWLKFATRTGDSEVVYFHVRIRNFFSEECSVLLCISSWQFYDILVSPWTWKPTKKAVAKSIYKRILTNIYSIHLSIFH